MHTSTISSAIKGTGRRPSAATVVALTRELGDDVAGWLGAGQAVAWDPPEEASLLTGRQRKAIDELIRAMTEKREDVGNDVRSASNTRAGASPAGKHTKRVRQPEDVERVSPARSRPRSSG